MASRTSTVVVMCVLGVSSACSKPTPDQHAGAAAVTSTLSPSLPPTKAIPAAPVTQSAASDDKAGQRGDEKVSSEFNGAKYLLRWTNGTQFEFTPPGQEDLDKWTDMVTLLLFPTAKDADALAQVANATLSRYQDRKGTMIGTGTVPPPGANPGEQFIAAVLPDPSFLEFVQSRFLLIRGQGVALLYAHRVYGTRAGDEMSQWMQHNGPLLEHQLMNFDAAPLVSTVQGLP